MPGLYNKKALKWVKRNILRSEVNLKDIVRTCSACLEEGGGRLAGVTGLQRGKEGAHASPPLLCLCTAAGQWPTAILIVLSTADL